MPNLEHARKHARALLKSTRARGDATCRALHDAQLVVAREGGFRSWAALKAHWSPHPRVPFSMVYGGTPKGTAAASAATWDRIYAFLRSAVATAPA